MAERARSWHNFCGTQHVQRFLLNRVMVCAFEKVRRERRRALVLRGQARLHAQCPLQVKSLIVESEITTKPYTIPTNLTSDG
eukprot:5980249-Amphidinium_carterae.1